MTETLKQRQPGAKRRSTMLGMVAIAGFWMIGTAHADVAPIKALVKSMSDYLAAQKSMTFDVESTLEVITTEGQRIGLASSGAVEVSRPDKIRVIRKGGFADVEAVFDGKTLSLLGKNLNLYTQIEIPGNIDHLVDEMRDKYGRPLPAADLLMSDSYTQLMTDAKDIKYLGPGVIFGRMCEHVAIRTDEVDLQLWIADGDAPYPCRYTITSRSVQGQPQYSVDIWNWKSGVEASAADFTFKPPEGAKLVKPADLKDTDELPSHLAPKN